MTITIFSFIALVGVLSEQAFDNVSAVRIRLQSSRAFKYKNRHYQYYKLNRNEKPDRV